MNILFVDHVCHKKTRSADFFLDILREEHIVDCHYYGTYYKCEKCDAEYNIYSLFHESFFMVLHPSEILL